MKEGVRIWIKCPKHHVDSAIYRATVRVCPKCGDILDAEELFRLLEELKIDKALIEKIRSAILYKNILQSNQNIEARE